MCLNRHIYGHKLTPQHNYVHVWNLYISVFRKVSESKSWSVVLSSDPSSRAITATKWSHRMYVNITTLFLEKNILRLYCKFSPFFHSSFVFRHNAECSTTIEKCDIVRQYTMYLAGVSDSVGLLVPASYVLHVYQQCHLAGHGLTTWSLTLAVYLTARISLFGHTGQGRPVFTCFIQSVKP